tara:strand:- start:24459 stop:25259 length:801 start_codon:yes stop_codon:yes gene_type:complete
MNLDEAHKLMDLLLDKADQPYFTNEEKNEFLKLAISDFINFHYDKMLIDEDSRKAMAPFIDYNGFTLSKAEILGGSFIYNNRYPAFSEKYLDTSSTGERGYFKYGNQYMVPKQHLYVLNISAHTYNVNEIIDLTTGLPYSNVTTSDIKTSEAMPVKNVDIRDFYHNRHTPDPFNSSRDPRAGGGSENLQWAYIENRIIFSFAGAIRSLYMQTILLPLLEQAFTDVTEDASAVQGSMAIPLHYQNQIIEDAVLKMTRTDVGMMTGPN